MAADPELKETIANVLRPHFPHDTVDVSDGYHDNVHVLVVSRAFDQYTETEKQEYLWGLIDQSELSEDQKRRISLILPLSPAELK